MRACARWKEQSPWTRQQNKWLDRHLAPSIGPNSASQIVTATNSGMAVWHLGMGNIAQTIMTVFSFMNTVIPEMAMVIRSNGTQSGSL